MQRLKPTYTKEAKSTGLKIPKGKILLQFHTVARPARDEDNNERNFKIERMDPMVLSESSLGLLEIQ